MLDFIEETWDWVKAGDGITFCLFRAFFVLMVLGGLIGTVIVFFTPLAVLVGG